MTLFHRRDRPRFVDPMSLLPRALRRLYSIWVSTTYPFASMGRNLSIHYTCDLRRPIAPWIKIGNSVSIAQDAWINISVLPQKDAEPVIILDDGCIVARRSTISAKNSIHLERDVMLAPSVLIMDHNHAYEDVSRSIKEQGVTEGGRIRIGQGCWLGHGAAIVCSKGELTLGRNCVVGANAVIAKSYPPYSIISGNPARVVSQFDPVKGAWVLGSSRSVDIEPAKQEQRDTGVVRP